MKKLNIFVSGRVQGVCFRAFSQDNASYLGLNGWVRNLYDGRVEILVEGKEEKIHEFLQFINQGPAMSVVNKVEIKELDYKGDLPPFYVTYSR